MAVGMLTAGTVVKAVDHWNPLATLANTTEAGLATEITNRTTAVAAINTRLANNIAGGGISDLPSWKTTIDNRTTDASTGNSALGTRMTAAESSITTLTARTTNASTGNTQLGARVTALEGITADATTGNAALGTRVSALEGAGAAVGAWAAVTSFQNGWANRTTGSPPYYALKVRTEPGGVIRINGNITAAAGAANGTQLFTLPTIATYAPSLEAFVPIMDSGAVARALRITSAGTVFMYSSATSANVLNINGTFPGPSSGA
jgi:hypothetical protein